MAERRPSTLTKLTTILVAGFALVVPAKASARTPDQVRQALIRAHLIPRPLYPAILPNPLDNYSQTTFTHGRHGFTISYACKRDPAETS